MARTRWDRWLSLYRSDPAFIASRLPMNIRYLRIIGVLMLVLECFMLTVYALSQGQGLPTLPGAYVVYYLTAIAASLLFLAASWILRGRNTGLQLCVYLYVVLLGGWSVAFGAYDVSQGNSSYVFSQILILVAVGICGRPWLHCLYNAAAYGLFAVLLAYQPMDEQRFYSEIINTLIMLVLACMIVLYSYYERRKLYRNAQTVEEQNRQLTYLANVDALTDIPNRRSVLARLDECLERDEGTLYVAMIDIDHFKRYNDSHGHIAGDRSLKQIAGILTSCLDTGGMLGRYGGEEFLLILEELPPDEVERRMDELLAAVNAAAIPFPEVTQGHITVSAGGCFTRPGQDAQSVLVRADKALYRAKRTGRNRYYTEPAGE